MKALITTFSGAGAVAYLVNPPPAVPGSHMGTGFYSQLLLFQSSSLLWPRKAVEDGPSAWAPAPTWETRRKHLAPGFGSARCRP